MLRIVLIYSNSWLGFFIFFLSLRNSDINRGKLMAVEFLVLLLSSSC